MGGLVIIQKESGECYDMLGRNSTLKFNVFINDYIHIMIPPNTEAGEIDLRLFLKNINTRIISFLIIHLVMKNQTKRLM